MQYRDCALRPATDGRDFTCTIHDARVLTGCQLGASPSGPLPDCAALRQRIRDPNDALRDLVGEPASGLRPRRPLPAWFQGIVATQAGFAARVALAGAPRTTSAVLAHLAHDQWGTVRATVAARPDLREAVQWALAYTEDPGTRSVIAGNPTVTPLTQRILAHDPENHVRQVLAGNEAAIPSVQAGLARDPDTRVRQALLTVGEPRRTRGRGR